MFDFDTNKIKYYLKKGSLREPALPCIILQRIKWMDTGDRPQIMYKGSVSYRIEDVYDTELFNTIEEAEAERRKRVAKEYNL